MRVSGRLEVGVRERVVEGGGGVWHTSPEHRVLPSTPANQCSDPIRQVSISTAWNVGRTCGSGVVAGVSTSVGEDRRSNLDCVPVRSQPLVAALRPPDQQPHGLVALDQAVHKSVVRVPVADRYPKLKTPATCYDYV